MEDRLASADVGAIEQVVRDYFESWFDGDVERMRGALHPRLAKRRPPRPGTADKELHEVSFEDMLRDVSSGPKTQFDRWLQITILDIAGDIATAKVASQPFDEYVHLARIDGRWQVVNTLYRRR